MNIDHSLEDAVADRYIPPRSELDIDWSHHRLGDRSAPNQASSCGTPPLYKDIERSICGSQKVLTFVKKPPVPEHKKDTQALFSCRAPCPRPLRATRKIPQHPELTLEAPGLEDDFYLNLLDWNRSNVLAIGLQSQVFLWNGNDGSICQLDCATPGADEQSPTTVTSVRWSGDHLAVGTCANTIQLWDAKQGTRLRTLRGHRSRVSSLDWNRFVLSSGGKDTTVLNYDVRAHQPALSSFCVHTSEVCGLRWNPQGQYLASGGNDNLVAIWDSRFLSQATQSSPLRTLCSHKAAVKALSWAPFQSHLLATGGGTGDRCIRFWNTQTGAELSHVDTGSQVCALQWAPNASRELVSSHGYAKNQLAVWKYPSLKQVGEDLVGHSQRALHLSLSPDGVTVASAAADEKLCFWRIFEPHRMNRSAKNPPAMMLQSRQIR